MAIDGLSPAAGLLILGVLLDAILGDPRYALHPIRLMGKSLSAFETLLRRAGVDGYAGGTLLFALLAATWIAIPCALVVFVFRIHPIAGMAAHVFAVYSLIAMRDLVDHVRAVDAAAGAGKLADARAAIGMLVGRDTDRMDLNACRRAAIESLSESFVDGYVSAIFWYVLLGLPGLFLFKIASTMDSMVGYKTDRYLRFGWFGARLDDVMNYVPARLAWIVVGVAAIPFPGLSIYKGWRIGWQQHGILPGPNPGWSEATMAGVLQRRLIGPIWRGGAQVTEVWIGDPADPEAGTHEDVMRALRVTIAAAALVLACGAAVLVLA